MNLKLLLTLALLIVSPLTWAANHTGTIIETMSAGGYTYAKIMENQKEFWIAGPKAAVKAGDTVSFGEQISMPNFTSKSLNRTFKTLMFVGNISQGTSAKPATHNSNIGQTKNAKAVAKVSKAEGGYTVAELFDRKAELAGKTVKVRGQVVKVSSNIMKKNWIHIQDGTGTADTNDIIFLAKTSTVNAGDTVLAQGTLIMDKDFGFGYKYAVIVEDASFEVGK
ncbi:MAG: hypothetical protein ABW166_05280 [Sedimenticola sp.]